MLNLSLGKTYTFNTKAPGILGVSIRNAKLIGILDYESAVAYDNIDLKYRTIFPVLPAGSPDNPRECIFYRFLSESGEKIVLADQWIDDTTVDTINHITLRILVTNVSIQDQSRLRDAMLALGYTQFDIKQV